MSTSTIFIASSEGAKPLAQELASRLRQEMGDALTVHEWWVNWFGLGQNTLASLVEACRRSDFAAILLTKDDSVPRPNCVFEPGMFTGVFGTKGKGERGEARRCFLLSSIPATQLFTDLHGIVVEPIEERQSSGTIQLAASKIRDAIRELGPVSKPEIECYTEQEVLEREQVGSGGSLERGSEVVVNLTRPIEVDDKVFARRISANLQANVYYKYFFSAAENLRVIAQLFHSVATAEVDSTDGSPDSSERNRRIETSLERMQRQFGIWFLSSGRPFEFCIHNADRDAAVCYLRRPSDTRFVDWCAGDKAIEIVKDVQRSLTASREANSSVFRKSSDFDLYAPGSASKRAAIERELRVLFDESFHERVLTMCFGRTRSAVKSPAVVRSKRTR